MDIAAIERIGKVVILIEKTLRCVGMRVDDEGGAVHGFGGNFGCHFRGRLGGGLAAEHGGNGKKQEGDQIGNQMGDQGCVQGASPHRLGVSIERLAPWIGTGAA
jgi:hypothetical protein